MPGINETRFDVDEVVRGVVLVVGVAVQIAGTVGVLSGALDRPVVGLLLAALGCGMASSVLIQVAARKRPAVVLVMLSGGESLRLTSRYRPGPRAFAVLGLSVLAGAFGWYAWTSIPAIRGMSTDQALGYDAYPRRYLENALVESTFNGRLSRYTTYTGRIDDESRRDHGLSFTTAASLQRRNTFYGPTTLDYETFAIEFDLQARPEHAPVKVDAIRVIIDAYEPLPNYERPVGTGPIDEAEPFYMYQAVLAQPTDGRNRKVLAHIVAADDTPAGEACDRLCLRRPTGGDVLVNADGPTAFLVKIEAPEPGFYGFDVEVMLSSGLELQRFGVASFTHVLFY